MRIPRRMEHFWKWRFKMSERLNVSRQRTHMYGRSPVSAIMNLCQRSVQISRMLQDFFLKKTYGAAYDASYTRS